MVEAELDPPKAETVTVAVAEEVEEIPRALAVGAVTVRLVELVGVTVSVTVVEPLAKVTLTGETKSLPVSVTAPPE